MRRSGLVAMFGVAALTLVGCTTAEETGGTTTNNDSSESETSEAKALYMNSQPTGQKATIKRT